MALQSEHRRAFLITNPSTEEVHAFAFPDDDIEALAQPLLDSWNNGGWDPEVMGWTPESFSLDHALSEIRGKYLPLAVQEAGAPENWSSLEEWSTRVQEIAADPFPRWLAGRTVTWHWQSGLPELPGGGQ